MSWIATGWALTQKTGSPTSKLVLLLLAEKADEDGISWPRLRTLADQGECSPSTIRRCLAELEAAKLIEVTPQTRTNGSQTVNRYRVMAPWIVPSPPLQSDTPLQSEGGRGCQSEGGAPFNLKGGPFQSEGGRGCQSDTPRTPIENLPPLPPGHVDFSEPRAGQVEGGGDAQDDELPIQVRVLMDAGLSRRQAEPLAPKAAQALAHGWEPKALTAQLTKDLPAQVRSMPALLASRLDGLPPAPRPTGTVAKRATWNCPDCHGSGKREDPDDPRRILGRCDHPNLPEDQ